LVAGQSTGSFDTDGGAVSKTALFAERTYTFELTEAYGDGICYQYGAGEFKIIVNGEPEAIGSNEDFGDAVRESLDVVGRSTGPTVDSGRIPSCDPLIPSVTSLGESLLTKLCASRWGSYSARGKDLGALLEELLGERVVGQVRKKQ
jgi:hypothetical protein